MLHLRLSVCALPLAALLALPACQSFLSPDTEQTIEVGETLVPCWGPFPQHCLLVRESGSSDFGLWHQPIDGFEPAPGYRYRLRVERTTVPNPPQDAPRFTYRLLALIDRRPTPHGQLLAQLDEAAAKWLVARPAQHYTMIVERQCFCGPDARGQVQLEVEHDGGPHEAQLQMHFVDDGRVVPSQLRYVFPTVQDLFSLLRMALANDAHRIEVEWDDVTGVPRRVYIDYRAGIADDEVEYRVLQVAPRT